MSRRSKQQKYFLHTEGKELLSNLKNKIEEYHSYTKQNGIEDTFQRLYSNYYSGSLSKIGMRGNSTSTAFTLNKLQREGAQGARVGAKDSISRNLIQHQIRLITKHKPAVTAITSNSDVQSQTIAKLGSQLSEYYLWQDSSAVGKTIDKAVEYAIALLEAFVVTEYDRSQGDIVGYDQETMQPIFRGDNSCEVYHTLDMIRDVNVKDPLKNKWYIIRKYKDRYDLAAQYPHLESDILNLSEESQDRPELFNSSISSSDQVPYYVLYHKKTPAMPNGAHIEFSGDILFYQGNLEYSEFPIDRIAVSDLIDSNFGFSESINLLQLQQIHDILLSSILSNQASGGVSSIWLNSGDENIDVDQISEGLQLIRTATEPKPLNLTKTPPEIFNQLANTERSMEKSTSISSTQRGATEANLKSGSAIVAAISQSSEFMGPIDQARNTLIENVAYKLIDNLRKFDPEGERTALIVGQQNKPWLSKFKGQDLLDIKRIKVSQTNALERSAAGRKELAQFMVEQGLIKTPQSYLKVIETGSLDAISDPIVNKELMIESAREALQNGVSMTPILIDPHKELIEAAYSLLSTPEPRQDFELVKRVMEFIQVHLDLWRQMPPDLLALTGQQPPPQMPSQQPQNAPQQPQNQPPASPPSQVAKPIEGGLDQVQAPRMPTNPLTNQQFDPIQGQ
jgi:hypothetical protein